MHASPPSHASRHRNRFIPLILPILFQLGLPATEVAAQQPQGHRIAVGAGTVLLIPDSTCGLILWATGPGLPGRRPPPDFVGWFRPERIAPWAAVAREFLDRVPPEEGEPAHAWLLTSVDGGLVSVLRSADEPGAGLAFGHPRERQRWLIQASVAEVKVLLDSMEVLARRSRLDSPPDLGYANPTNRRATPDRVVAPLPELTAPGGEIWATVELDATGSAIAGTERILWATRPALGRAVLQVLPGYRYVRKDGGRPGRLRVYQRFRVR